MRLPSRYFLLLALAVQFGCSNNKVKQDKNVGIFLMKSYELVPGKCLVENETIVIQDTAFVKNDEILKYSVSTHEFTVSNSCQQKFASLAPRTPLAVMVNNEVIFTAINMPAYISSTCDDSIVMTVDDSTAKIRVTLGYPGINQARSIVDKRNNVKLVSALEKQGKLQ